MFGKTPKYLLIDISNTEKAEYVVKREFICNDFVNVYYAKGWNSVRNIFNFKNIPLEFQKIIVGVSSSSFSKNMEEFLTGYHFDEVKIRKDKFCGTRKIYALGKRFDGNTIIDDVRFDSDIHYITAEEVVKFYKQLSDSGYLNDYLDSINQLLRSGKTTDSLVKTFTETTEVSSKRKNKKYNMLYKR